MLVGAGACLPPPGEACGDGWCADGYYCAFGLNTCLKRSGCGNFIIEVGEECDDGNLANNDGCDNDCAVSLLTYIKSSNPKYSDYFGYSVALSADGSTQQAYVKAANTGAGDQFGCSVALSTDGATLAVGALAEASVATRIGGDQNDNSAAGTGAAYVFTRSDTTWSQQAYVKASNTGAGDSFGASVALSVDGSTLAVGAWSEDSAATGIGGDQLNNSVSAAGAAYVSSSRAWLP